MKHRFTIISDAVAERACAVIRSLPRDKRFEVTICEAKSSRSLQQNALYWKWMDAIRLHVADSTGDFYSAEDLHEWFKTKFLPANPVTIDGEMQLARRTTTSLSVRAMSEYMNLIDRYCVEHLNLYLPQPGIEDAA